MKTIKKGLSKVITICLIAVFAFGLVNFTGSQTDAASKKISQELQQKGAKSSNQLLPVIVQTTDGLSDKHRGAVQRKGGSIKKELSIIKGFSAKLPFSAIEELAASEDIKFISCDGTVSTCLDVASEVMDAPTQWEAGNTGKGVTVAVIDTGIYPHPDLTQPTNRIIAFKDIVNGRTSPYDDCGHGTHVAGIIAGNGTMSNGRYKGMAPEANLVGVKVLDSAGNGNISDVIAGLQWVVENREVYGIKVINMSLGASTTESYTTDPLSQAAEAAYNAGLTVVASAGNSGPAEGTITTPAINPHVIAVGAINDMNTVDTADDVIAEFTSRGPTIDGLQKPDQWAPGVNITSLAADTSYLPKKNSGSGAKGGKPSKARATKKPAQTTISDYYVTMSGTSMASPMVAGRVVLEYE